MYANNPKYTEVYRFGNYVFYQPTDITSGYHDRRYVEAYHQQIYANSGATAEILETITDKMIELCNTELKNANLRTDLALLAQNIRFRLKNPVDEHCAIRQAAILLFCETGASAEDPDTIEQVWTDRKVKLALDNPSVYTFFLTLGVACIPKYSELWPTLTEDYFIKRETTLKSLWPEEKKSSAVSPQ